MLSLFIPLSWLRLELGGVTVTGTMLLAALVLVYYFLLDATLALAAAVVSVVLVSAADLIARQPSPVAVAWFCALFIGGWALQLAGHAFEGRKPALTDNLFQIFVAPIFLCAEILFALGYKPELRATVQRRASELRATAGLRRQQQA
jgi:uncharacterized membrane protein YGL010W